MNLLVIFSEFVSIYFEKDEARKETIKKEFGEALVETLKNLEGILTANGGEWFAGSGGRAQLFYVTNRHDILA